MQTATSGTSPHRHHYSALPELDETEGLVGRIVHLAPAVIALTVLLLAGGVLAERQGGLRGGAGAALPGATSHPAPSAAFLPAERGGENPAPSVVPVVDRPGAASAR